MGDAFASSRELELELVRYALSGSPAVHPTSRLHHQREIFRPLFSLQLKLLGLGFLRRKN
jgi:hypothetical protein